MPENLVETLDYLGSNTVNFFRKNVLMSEKYEVVLTVKIPVDHCELVIAQLAKGKDTRELAKELRTAYDSLCEGTYTLVRYTWGTNRDLTYEHRREDSLLEICKDKVVAMENKRRRHYETYEVERVIE